MSEQAPTNRPAPAGLGRLRDLGVTWWRGTDREDPAAEADWAIEPDWTGTEPPGVIEARETQREVIRTFCFVDICGFTEFTDTDGPHAALSALAAFRTLVRDTTARRGVRVAKWLGDGALLVAVHSPPVVAAAVDIVSRARGGRLEIRAAVATGPALLFDGDDYIGGVVNLAARLCDMAGANDVLVDAASRDELPDWIEAIPHRAVSVRGMGRITSIARLQPIEGTEVPATPIPPED